MLGWRIDWIFIEISLANPNSKWFDIEFLLAIDFRVFLDESVVIMRFHCFQSDGVVGIVDVCDVICYDCAKN